MHRRNWKQWLSNFLEGGRGEGGVNKVHDCLGENGKLGSLILSDVRQLEVRPFPLK